MLVWCEADRAFFVDVVSEDSGSEFHGEPSDTDNPGHRASPRGCGVDAGAGGGS